ncbi:MAG TPA: prepilin-type N-terminal cleavage/methylation domain-containing protein [Candidatus Acidoferrum sp.]|nr:prepilin-type N-terminal cleavage/methylation domain-containing protein [Candidatus Acidoferrum sp.]
MKLAIKHKKQSGFTMVELMVSVAIFVVISSAIFSLLGNSQKQFRTESQLLGSFQEARLGLDQIVRDAGDAGYPPLNHFAVTPLANFFAIGPLGWQPGYAAGVPCLIGTAGGGTCATPSDFDVIFEGDVNDGTGVRWTRYQLQGTTLFRGSVAKTVGTSPGPATLAAGVMLPYVTNVMNNAPAAQIATFQASYPGMFPGGAPQPIFQFTCDTPAGTVLCQNAGASNSPSNVRDVEITLIVMSPEPDIQTKRWRLVELNGRGHRLNPNQ